LATAGRLHDDVGLAEAEAEVSGLGLTEMRSSSTAPARYLAPAAESRATAVARDRTLSLWLAAGAALLLLIAATNVAGLLAVRAMERRREVSLRLQVGATRGHVFAQLIAENVMLTMAATAVAWLVAGWVGSAITPFIPAATFDPWFDRRTAAVLIAFLAGAGILSGIVPAMQTARPTMRGTHPHAAGGRRALLREGLLAGQVAVTLVLSVGAALFAHSLVRVKSDLGYDLDRVIVATVDLDRAGIRRQADKRRIFDAILDALGQDGIVASAALSSASPLGSGQSYRVAPGGPPGSQTAPHMILDVTPEYFATIGTRVVEGRPFNRQDVETRQAVVMLDVDLAREMWPGQSVVGRCMEVTLGRPCLEVVGLTEPRRIGSLRQASREIFYLMNHDSTTTPRAILIRPRGEMTHSLPMVAAAIRRAAPELPFVAVRPLEDLANTQARAWRLGAWLFGLFGGLALLLSAVGLYSSLSFAVRQRTTEIGVRMALGAGTSDVVRLVLGQGLRALGVGWIVGIAATASLIGAVEHLLFGVNATDTLSLLGASLAVGLAGLAGCLLPTLRATRVNPVAALRAD
jgi:predicted permease